MINRYLVVCIASACYFSSEVIAANALKAREQALAKRQQLAAAAVAPVINVDKQLADEGRALKRVNSLFGADPNATAPNILSVGIQGQITQVRALHGVGDLVGVANFNAEPYLTTLDGAARVQLGHVHDFNQVQDFVSVADFEQEPYQTALHANARAQLGHVHDFHEVDDLIAEANFEQEPYQTTLHADARAQLGRVHDFNLVQDFVGEANFEQEPYQTALHANARAQLRHVHDFHEVDDLIAEANFEQQPYQTTLHADARTQLGRVHALHEVDNLATVDDDALNDGEDNEFTTILDNGLRHQMKGLQMVLKPSSIPDNLYQGQDGMGADFGARLKNFLTIAMAQDITDDNNHARQYVNELKDGIAVAATPAGADNGNLSDWEAEIQAVYDKVAPDRADYLGLIRGMVTGINHADAFDRVYLLSPLKAIIRDMLIHFPQ